MTELDHRKDTGSILKTQRRFICCLACFLPFVDHEELYVPGVFSDPSKFFI